MYWNSETSTLNSVVGSGNGTSQGQSHWVRTVKRIYFVTQIRVQALI